MKGRLRAAFFMTKVPREFYVMIFRCDLIDLLLAGCTSASPLPSAASVSPPFRALLMARGATHQDGRFE
jgi:hypothetical protein